MSSLKDEIERRLASNQVYYAHFVTNESMQQIRNETANDILKLIEKRIDSTVPHQSTTTGYLWAIGFNDALKQVKEVLK